MQEFDFNSDRTITYDEFQTALTRWIKEKVDYHKASVASIDSGSSSTSSMAYAGAAAGAGGGGGVDGLGRRGGNGAWSALVDPSQVGGAAAALLADLPPDDLAQLRVRGGPGALGEA